MPTTTTKDISMSINIWATPTKSTQKHPKAFITHQNELAYTYIYYYIYVTYVCVNVVSASRAITKVI